MKAYKFLVQTDGGLVRRQRKFTEIVWADTPADAEYNLQHDYKDSLITFLGRIPNREYRRAA